MIKENGTKSRIFIVLEESVSKDAHLKSLDFGRLKPYSRESTLMFCKWVKCRGQISSTYTGMGKRGNLQFKFSNFNVAQFYF